jgi:hypothetical protein
MFEKDGRRQQSNAERAGIITQWMSWANEHGAKGEVERLRGIIAKAYLRLDRLDDSNPEAAHAREILQTAKDGGESTWP